MLIYNNQIEFNKDDLKYRYRKIIDNKNLTVWIWGYIIGEKKIKTFLAKKEKLNLNDVDYIVKNLIESGKFILIIKLKNPSKVFVINDRWGLIPLFSSRDFKYISDLPEEIINKLSKIHLDYRGIYEFLNFDYFLDDRYFVKEIKRIYGGTILYYDNNVKRFKIKSYYKFVPKFDKKPTKYDYRKIYSLFQEGIEKLYEEYGFENVFTHLSGGYDTRLIYFADKKINEVITFTISSDEFKFVKKILEKFPKSTHVVEFNKLNFNIYKRLFEEATGYVSLTNPQHIILLDYYNNFKKIDVVYDGFAGDAILGGTYLDLVIEFFREFRIRMNYSPSRIQTFKSFNVDLLSGKWKKKIQRFDKSEIDVYKKIFWRNDRYTYFLFKFYNRGLNWLAPGSNIKNKYYPRIYPFFYYPLFDYYTQFSFDHLRIKKLYSEVYKNNFNDKILSLKDNFFRLNFKWPYKIRLLSAYLFAFYRKYIIKDNFKEITPFKKIILSNLDLRNYFIENMNALKSFGIVNKELKITKYIILKQYLSLVRLINLNLFIQKFNKKLTL